MFEAWDFFLHRADFFVLTLITVFLLVVIPIWASFVE